MLLQNQSNTRNFNKLIYIKFKTAKPKPSPYGLGLVWVFGGWIRTHSSTTVRWTCLLLDFML